MSRINASSNNIAKHQSDVPVKFSVEQKELLQNHCNEGNFFIDPNTIG